MFTLIICATLQRVIPVWGELYSSRSASEVEVYLRDDVLLKDRFADSDDGGLRSG